ncbi:[acyl-carrier-protein] S-malonyltransferase [Deferribacter desulfuricans SSM1]|uniref:Malonyl CoA-acyl carrier protein transacylase n=1 Tax=Deferribacter desulfuricans (strain DSM 14783 / JCM 11476 / NBRC 101012 / SSM1) TaxID=639282 RepID=D3PAP0_DEFDS|nr:ACP S-malonyltransferase [Deferribacter desulfuricans]BAI79663.1 [acyl-carrier-protein] S-malonyltransferase [Deferribacter desulfuricans SSM1]
MSKIAAVFPGQGSQYVGMGKDFFDKFEEYKVLIEKADEILKYDLSKLMFDGPEEELRLTYNTQPALLVMSVGIFNLIKDKINFDGFAGHSLGEYSAVVAAGGLTFEDALLAVHNRGKFMQEAVPVGVGAMAAVIGANVEDVERLCISISKEGFLVEPANYNSSNQIVVAGHSDAVEEFMSRAKEISAKRVVKLPVSAPFHCALMKPAEEKMKNYLEKVRFSDIDKPVYSNVTADLEFKATEIKENLIKQVSSPVRWSQLIEKMIEDGFTTFVEIGAGNVLTGLIKKINRQVKTVNISKVEDLGKLEDI